MGQVKVHLPGCHLQVDGCRTPGSFDAQNAPVKLTIFHADWMKIHPGWVHDARSRRGMHEGGQWSGLKPLLWGEPSRPGLPPEGETGKGRFKFLAAAGNWPRCPD